MDPPPPHPKTALPRLTIILGAQRLNKLMDSKILWLNLCPSSFCWKWWQRGQRNYKGRSEVLSQLISLTMQFVLFGIFSLKVVPKSFVVVPSDNGDSFLKYNAPIEIEQPSTFGKLKSLPDNLNSSEILKFRIKRKSIQFLRNAKVGDILDSWRGKKFLPVQWREEQDGAVSVSFLGCRSYNLQIIGSSQISNARY